VAIVGVLEGWSDFFVVQAGAAAVLAGLVFVGVSINLEQILAMPSLPGRALGAIVILVGVLIQSSLVLVPDQSTTALGLEMLGVGLVVLLVVSAIQRDVYLKRLPEYRKQFLLNVAFAQVAVLAFVVAGVLLVATGESGIYWTVPAVLVSYLVAISDAWVLLVEIHR
jgi:modulator of FtsH protease